GIITVIGDPGQQILNHTDGYIPPQKLEVTIDTTPGRTGSESTILIIYHNRNFYAMEGGYVNTV
ncbi:unnamed protein product, partial [marine sediment metagenome]